MKSVGMVSGVKKSREKLWKSDLYWVKGFECDSWTGMPMHIDLP